MSILWFEGWKASEGIWVWSALGLSLWENNSRVTGLKLLRMCFETQQHAWFSCLDSWWVLCLSVVVNSSLIVREPRVLRISASIYNVLCWLTLTMKTLKQEKDFCNILVYHMCCLSGPSVFLAAFLRILPPLSLIMCAGIHGFTTGALQMTSKRFSLAFHLRRLQWK